MLMSPNLVMLLWKRYVIPGVHYDMEISNELIISKLTLTRRTSENLYDMIIGLTLFCVYLIAAIFNNKMWKIGIFSNIYNFGLQQVNYF